MENNGKQQQELQALTVRANQLEEKNAQWQVVTRKLQSSLKQAQHPALPATDDELADFAAGMAMGFDILGVLEQRNEQDVHVDKAAFLAGISERYAANAGYLRRNLSAILTAPISESRLRCTRSSSKGSAG